MFSATAIDISNEMQHLIQVSEIKYVDTTNIVYYHTQWLCAVINDCDDWYRYDYPITIRQIIGEFGYVNDNRIEIMWVDNNGITPVADTVLLDTDIAKAPLSTISVYPILDKYK